MRVSSHRAVAIAALTVSIPLSIFVACGSSTFTSDDQDATTVSPQNDSGAGDSQTTTDADAAAVVDAATPTWCQTNAPNAFFCADFDEGDSTDAYLGGKLASPFHPIIVDGGNPGTVIGLGDGGLSSPAPLSVFVSELSSSVQFESAQIVASLSDLPKVSGFQLDFDIRTDVTGDPSISGQTVQLMLNDLNTTTSRGTYQMNVAGGSNLVNGMHSVAMGPRPTVGVWTHHRMIVSLNGNLSDQIDDGGIFDAGPSGVLSTTTKPSLTFGQSIDGLTGFPAGGTGLSFDNIVLVGLDGG